MTQRIRRVAATAMFGAMTVDCDQRPSYQAPAVAKETVTLKAENAVFIDGIDDHKVDGLQTYTNPPFGHIQGGNETVATAGHHTVQVAMYVGHSTMGSAFSLALADPQTQTVDIDFVPGHAYLFTTNITSVKRNVRVHDLTAEAAATRPAATADAR